MPGLRTSLVLCTLFVCSAARADGDDFKYALGLQLQNQPESPGSDLRKTSVKPVWALRWGRLRLSTGGGNALMGFGSEVYGAGASADLLTRDKLRIGISLRFDGGRNSGDARATQGLPDVRRTLRGRLFAGYAITEDLQWSGSLSQDLLGHGGGLILATDISKRLMRTQDSEWSVGTGLSAGDATQMRSYFGVRPEDMQASGLPAYQPGAGLKDVWIGTSYTRVLHRNWVAQASAGVSRQVGAAADSPLVVSPTAANFAISLAYRR